MTGPARLRVDFIACDGRGLCAAALPELITLDDWGFPVVSDRDVPARRLGDARATVRACPLLALRLDAGTGYRARSARLSLAIRRGQRRSPSRCRRCRRDSSGGPPAAPSPSVTEPPPEEDRPMISVPPEASATRRAMLRPRPVDPPLD